jgi:hypothetical protein
VKIFSAILSLIIITTSIFSFGDEFLINNDEMVAITHITETNTIHEGHHIDIEGHKEHHDDKNHPEDSNCDKECHFCICSCTSSNVIVSVFKFEFSNLEYFSSKITISHNSSYTNQYLDSIFQPPQV